MNLTRCTTKLLELALNNHRRPKSAARPQMISPWPLLAVITAKHIGEDELRYKVSSFSSFEFTVTACLEVEDGVLLGGSGMLANGLVDPLNLSERGSGP